MVSTLHSRLCMISSPMSLFSLPQSVMSNNPFTSSFNLTIVFLLFINNKRLLIHTIVISMESHCVIRRCMDLY